jgi:chromate transporter
MILLELFWSFFQIGLFSIGGGYAAMPIIQRQIVEVKHWLDLAELADVVAISQMTPGPIAINSATFVGLRIAGFGGALVATLGCVLPSFIIVLAMALIYYKYRNLALMQGILGGMRPAVVAMIASAGLSFLVLAFWNGQAITIHIASMDFIAIALFLICLLVLRIRKSNPILVLAGSGLAGLIAYSLF